MTSFKIGSKLVGSDLPTYFIADIAANHDGSLERALMLIEKAKEAGADAAKFQNFQAPKIVSKYGFEKLGGQIAHQAGWKKSVFDVYKAAEIGMAWTEALKKHCDKVGITYFTSPYDVQSIDSVDPFVPAYKIGSGDITFTSILKYIASKRKPVLIASGASTLNEVQEAVALLREHGGADLPICLMQCNTNYTGKLENFKYIHLNVLRTYATLFPDVLLGLSDHTPGHATVLGAVALGARMVEKHFTDDNDRDGPDHPFSMNPKAWRDMVDRTRELELALGQTDKKIEANEKDSVVVQRRAIYLSRAIKKGDVFSAENIEPLRPCPSDAIAPRNYEKILGTHAPRDFIEGDYLKYADWGLGI